MQPYFYSVSEFIAMGTHGVFVWSCWAITVGTVFLFVFYSRNQRKTLIKQLTIQQTRQAQRTSKMTEPVASRPVSKS